MNSQGHTPNRRPFAPAFTLVELLVVIGIIAILTAILLPAMTSAREKANRVKCLADMRTISQAIVMYASQNKGKVPMHRGGANWLWDISYDTRDWLVEQGNLSPQIFYCASYTHDTKGMWDFCGPAGPTNGENFMIAGFYWLGKRPGYASGVGKFTPNTLTNMPFRYPQEDRWIEKLTDRTIKSTASELALFTDIVLSNTDSRDWSNKNFLTIRGGYFAGHGTTHRSGDRPLGGNVLFVDGHGEWRNFASMKNRLTGWPHFWY